MFFDNIIIFLSNCIVTKKNVISIDFLNLLFIITYIEVVTIIIA
jgi:hypothetical protein